MANNSLLRTKSVEQSIADTDEPRSRLRRDLTAVDLTVFGVAVCVGAGIFTLAASTAGDVSGPAVSLSFVLAAIACGLAALCYTEFASTVPVAGSAYTYSYATFGELIAWIIGWDLVLEFSLAAAVVAKGWSQYLAEVIGLLGLEIATTFAVGGVTVDWAAAALVAALTVLLALGTKLSSRVSQVITAIKVAVVLLVIVVGLGYLTASNYSPFVPPAAEAEEGGSALDQSLISLLLGGETSTFGLFGVFAGASLVFFAFIGFDIIATAAEETRNPQRDMPRGILGALAGLTTVVMVLLLGQTRVLFAMSRDGLVPRGLSATGSRGTPVRITVGVGVVVAIAAAVIDFGTLAELVNVGTLFAFVLVSIGVLVLRRTRPDLKRGFRVPWVPVLPIAAVLACVWLMLNLTAFTWVRFAVWMAIGVVVYFLYSRRHSVLGKRQKGSSGV